MNFRVLRTLGASIALATAAQAGPLTVDGSLSDWGVNIADNNGSTFTPIAGVFSHEEDTNDNSNSYYLGPNWGGQNYDAEWLGVHVDGNTLYIGLSTGQRPDNGLAYYSPGDIRLETSAGRFGIEVGGGIGDAGAAATFSITEGDDGTTYGLNGSGYTTSVATSAADAGAIYKGGDWINDPIGPAGPVQLDDSALGTFVGMSDYIYSDGGTLQHGIIELSFDMSLLGNGVDINGIHWRPSCGNDELNLSVVGVRTQEVPEPGTVALFGTALAAFVWVRRRKA